MPKPFAYTARSGQVTWKVRFRHKSRNCQETFSTKPQAQVFCNDVTAHGSQVALNLLDAQESDRDASRLDELAAGFFAWKAGRVRSDRTVSDYRRDYRNWIAPTLGHLPALRVDERAVQEWVEAMTAGTLGRSALSPKSVVDRHALLHGIFAWAIAPSRRLVEHNPCIGTELPKRKLTQPKGLRPAEWQALAPALRQIDSHGADLADFLLATGWRFSEAAALSAYSVEDDDGAAVHVTMGRVLRRNAAGQHVIVEDAKSSAGLRRIKLDRDAATMVRRRLDDVTGDGLVFTTRNGSQWHYANFLNRTWKPAVAAAKLKRRPTPHWLRHTSVAWLVMSGRVSLPEIQRRIGHESISTTINVYGRMIDDVPDVALEAFAAIRSGTKRAPELEG